jgi:hypothetical protein
MAAEQQDESRFKVKEAKGGVIITKYLGSEQEVNIPPRIENMPVIEIGRGAFAEKKLEAVTIPDSVISIRN